MLRTFVVDDPFVYKLADAIDRNNFATFVSQRGTDARRTSGVLYGRKHVLLVDFPARPLRVQPTGRDN
jgi:hypothetical protein